MILPFTSAFSITQIITIPLIILSVINFAFLIRFVFFNVKIIIYKIDLLLIIFWLIVSFALLINSSAFISLKPYNHYVAYTFVVFFNYIILKNIFINYFSIYDLQDMCKSVGWGVLICSIFGILEFILKTFLFVNVDLYIPRAEIAEYDPTILASFIRIRSLVEESGHLAYYLELLAPIGIYGFRHNKRLCVTLTITSVLCFLLTFSSGGYGIVLILLFIYFMKNIFKFISNNYYIVINIRKIIIFFVSISLLIFVAIYVGSLIYDIFYTIFFEKAFNSGSANDRNFRLEEGLKAFEQSKVLQQIVGNGPAAYDTLKLWSQGMVVLYLTFLLEIGLAGSIVFIIFILISLKYAFKIKDNLLKLIFVCAHICALIHFLFIANYYYPWLWVMLALNFFVYVKQNKIYQ
ncbi:hypothetical protein BWI93_14490 [Siphonobacter sp. BAB-5385]|nr:hypothetical protein BWI93_14490 [Siphonobacter sp. BAB-5385]